MLHSNCVSSHCGRWLKMGHSLCGAVMGSPTHLTSDTHSGTHPHPHFSSLRSGSGLIVTCSWSTVIVVFKYSLFSWQSSYQVVTRYFAPVSTLTFPVLKSEDGISVGVYRAQNISSLESQGWGTYKSATKLLPRFQRLVGVSKRARNMVDH